MATLSLVGLSVAGASLAGITVRDGELVVTLRQPVNTVTITATRPLLYEGRTLRHAVRRRKVGSLVVSINASDTSRRRTPLALKADVATG
jgi:hypothetical protein